MPGRAIYYSLGLDFSTQGLKAIIIDDFANPVLRLSMPYLELGKYNKLGNYKINKDSVVLGEKGLITQPTIMYFDALDCLLTRICESGVDLSRVRSLSTSAQQHGSVYWNAKAPEILSSLDPSSCLRDQLSEALSIPDSPIWMDSSTSSQCQRLEEANGLEYLASVTGNAAFERFTGAQIMKIRQKYPDLYNKIFQISLISSAVTSVLSGHMAPIDLSDGSGMNLLDIEKGAWNLPLLEVVGGKHDSTGKLPLFSKLMPAIPSATGIGTLSSYFRRRYNLPESIVVSGTGDNPSSLCAMNLQKDGIGISLGTSDTIFFEASQENFEVFKKQFKGKQKSEPGKRIGTHFFVSPIPTSDSPYMAMVCLKNGSQTRQKSMQEVVQHSNPELMDAPLKNQWMEFSSLISTSVPGNDGIFAILADYPEISPPIPAGRWFFKTTWNNKSLEDAELEEIESHTPTVTPVHAASLTTGQRARAVIEASVLSLRLQCTTAQSDPSSSHSSTTVRRVVVTGGGSQSAQLLQVIADIFGCPVYVADAPDAAAVGAAMRALHVGRSAVGGVLNYKDTPPDSVMKISAVSDRDPLVVAKALKPGQAFIPSESYARFMEATYGHNSSHINGSNERGQGVLKMRVGASPLSHNTTRLYNQLVKAVGIAQQMVIRGEAGEGELL